MHHALFMVLRSSHLSQMATLFVHGWQPSCDIFLYPFFNIAFHMPDCMGKILWACVLDRNKPLLPVVPAEQKFNMKSIFLFSIVYVLVSLRFF